MSLDIRLSNNDMHRFGAENFIDEALLLNSAINLSRP